MPHDLAQWLTLISSNYPSLELIFMVPKEFEPLKFDCILWKTIFVVNLLHLNLKSTILWNRINNRYLTIEVNLKFWYLKVYFEISKFEMNYVCWSQKFSSSNLRCNRNWTVKYRNCAQTIFLILKRILWDISVWEPESQQCSKIYLWTVAARSI